MFNNLKYKRKMFMTVLLPTTFIFLTTTIFLVLTYYKQSRELSQKYAIELTERYASNIEADLGRYFEISKAMAIQAEYLINNNKTYREDYNNYLKEILIRNPDIFATWVCFEKDGFDGKDDIYKNSKGSAENGRYIPFFYRDVNSISLDPLKNYENEIDGEYFLYTYNTGKSHIVVPYFYPIKGELRLITSIAYPIVVKGRVVAAVGIDVSIEKIIGLIKSIEYFDTGFAGIIDPKSGVIPLHEQDNMILEDEELVKKYSEEVINKNKTIIKTDFNNKLNLFVMSPISLGDDTWVMYTVVPFVEVMKSTGGLAVIGLMGSLVALILLSIIIIKNIDNTEKRLIKITNYANNIANGDFSILMKDKDLKGKDEFGLLVSAFEKVSENIKSLNLDAEKITTSAIYGKLYVRGNSDKFQGGYKEIIEGINGAIDTLVSHIDSIPTSIVIIDAENNIQYINKEGLNLFRIDKEDLSGTKCCDIFEMDNCKSLNCICKRAMNNGVKISSDTIVHSNNMNLEITHIANPLKDTRGKSIGVLMIFIDQTDIRREQRERIKAIEEKEIIKDDFFANISHELRTPISVIYSALQLQDIYLNNKDIDAIIKYNKVIKQNCFRLTRIINNIIDSTKINSGFIKPNFNTHNIVYLVENITESIITYAQNKKIDIIFDTDHEELYVKCDSEFIERIILNLLSNSIKYGKENGNIEVKIEKDDNANEVLILVKDDGIGIPKENIASLFNRFERVDKSLTRENEGSGIGLYLVKSLVEIQEGSILIESVINIGTQVLIKFPLVEIDDEACCTIGDLNKIDNNTNQKINVELSDIYY
jgi:signal transduction histidine kinase/HAMP domain-containing protein